jgi:hypothetical protein
MNMDKNERKGPNVNKYLSIKAIFDPSKVLVG